MSGTLFYAPQLLWDETRADALSRRAAYFPEARVVLAGIAYPGGGEFDFDPRAAGLRGPARVALCRADYGATTRAWSEVQTHHAVARSKGFGRPILKGYERRWRGTMKQSIPLVSIVIPV